MSNESKELLVELALVLSHGFSELTMCPPYSHHCVRLPWALLGIS